MRRIALVTCLAALPGFGFAQGKTVDCYCTDTTGHRVELGQQTCLSISGRSFMARCDMSLNVPIWRDTGRDCLSG
ncbi:hypothetical protein [Jannaschia marina]|uniref:hypothetical protein n=1 Tax=Jannaschia marina TaxID=2741674 RepID=UPI0015CA49E4|nr:hypothetical protein [Jannaschia marina]